MDTEKLIFDSVHLVPAQPGFYLVAEDRRHELHLGVPVVAWRITTYRRAPLALTKEGTPDDAQTFDDWDAHKCESHTEPVTSDGEPWCDCLGVQNPDYSITLWGVGHYDGLKDAQCNYLEYLIAVTREQEKKSGAPSA